MHIDDLEEKLRQLQGSRRKEELEAEYEGEVDRIKDKIAILIGRKDSMLSITLASLEEAKTKVYHDLFLCI